MSMTRIKAFRTALQATTPTKSQKFPTKEPSAQDGLKQDILFDESKRLYLFDPGRYVLFKGRWYLPGVTVRPVFELWNHKSFSSVEPKASLSVVEPKVCSLLSKNLLYMSASLDSLAAYQALKFFNEERTLLAHPPPPAPGPANITTKQKIKEYIRKRNVDAQLMSVEEFLSCLELEGCLNQLQVNGLEDLVTLSFEDMAARGIRQDHVVQIKNGVNYLMDLHNKTFDVFAPLPNAA